MNAVIDFVHTNRDRYVAELRKFLAIPSISALPEHSDDVARAAGWTAAELEQVGLEHVRLIETPGNPVVYADWLHAGDDVPTILFYGHYDVQPVDPLDEWVTPPFEASVREGEIYARGAADDKGQIFMHFKAVEAFMRQGGTLPVNIKFILEGEEEIGSKHLDGFVREQADVLSADVVVISDSADARPRSAFALLWVAPVSPTCRSTCGGRRPISHSGSFGGAVANPAFVLARVLSQMKDRGGRVKIPGFYDDVRPISDAEKAELAQLPFNERQYRRELGAPKLFGEKGFTTLERIWCRPTFEVNGLRSGFAGEGAKTVIPATAMAKVSMRLVPDQDPDRVANAFEAYLTKIMPRTVEATVAAAALRQAVDDRSRQPVRAGSRAGDRNRVQTRPGVSPRGRVHSGGFHVSRDARATVGAVWYRAAGRERPRAEREARLGQLPRRDRRHHRTVS